MKVDAIGRETMKRADPTSNVVNRQFADAVYVADFSVNCLMQIVESTTDRDIFLGQRVGGALKNIA